MSIFVTGAAGFIGFHLCKRLINEDKFVIGFDNLNNYYSKQLKLARINRLKEISSKLGKRFLFIEGDICDSQSLKIIFKEYKIEFVVNLAAQAGVRYSIKNPNAYIKSNIQGFANILEVSANFKIKHLIYASSSSVYGGSNIAPFSELNNVDHPISLYAASKRSNELMAHSYSHIYNLPTTGIRFFTVYGPWGRPDMALYLFTENILKNKPIEIFNDGKMGRSFTYIDDAVESLNRIIFNIPPSHIRNKNEYYPPNKSWSPFRIFNVGSDKSESLLNYIEALEEILNKKAKRKYLPLQQGDVKITASNNEELYSWIGYSPKTDLRIGIKKFVSWYKKYNGIK